MDIDEYQARALDTDQVSKTLGDEKSAAAVVIPLLGLAGEVGEILSEYKKYVRDGEAYLLFRDRAREELGDLLWYLACSTSKLGLRLSDVAEGNLQKCRARWEQVGHDQMKLPIPRQSLDEGFPSTERLSRRMVAEFFAAESGEARTRTTVDGAPFGDPLTDNRHVEDGYRFHDVLHLAYAAVLGWSPLTRKFLDRKRRSDPTVDEVEDGGRAIVIEEGITALVFSYAERRDFLRGLIRLDYELLRTVKTMTDHLEVSRRTAGEWEDAIMQGFRAWNDINAQGGGRVELDLDAGRVRVLPLGT
ncbi:MAG: nucleoside triphosphate pyrophosphohydrolase family protein [Dehalococcoidia bacterium]